MDEYVYVRESPAQLVNQELYMFGFSIKRGNVPGSGDGVIVDFGLYFGAGSTPKPVRWHILGATTIQLVVGLATASVRPFTSLAFGTLVWIFGIGMMGLWTARNGEFEPTDDPPPDTDAPDATPTGDDDADS